jgi:hypothetical protein
MPNKPTDPLLQRTRPTDALLDAEATITAADLDAAAAAFAQHAPAEARGLLDARVVEEK